MRAIRGLGVADAVLIAVLVVGSDRLTDFCVLLFPIIVLAALAAWMVHDGFRRGILMLEAAYSAIAAVIIWWVFFGGEHDAGYQLTLLVIPVLGLSVVLVAGAAAFTMKRRSGSAKRSG